MASHPAWVCGLKLNDGIIRRDRFVTPCVGVWIETRAKQTDTVTPLVTPCVGVWIETSYVASYVNSLSVTPCVGVWIETAFCRDMIKHKKVTPCVGVWIETILTSDDKVILQSHPAWVCGLKLIT